MNYNPSSDENQNKQNSTDNPVVEGEVTYLTEGEKKQSESSPSSEKPSIMKRIGHFLFSKETAVGRFLRMVLKWALVILISAGIGAGLIYYSLYLPSISELADSQQNLSGAMQKITDTEETLQRTENSLSELEDEHQQALTEIQNEKVHTLYYKTLNSITAVQLELEREDDLAANVAFKLARENLQELLPAVEQINPELASKLSKRIDTVFEEIDTVNTYADMEQFRNNTLKELEDVLFPEIN